MAIQRPSFTIGIEEEYFIVDKETRNLVSDMPDGLFDELSDIIEGQVSPEFIRSQIEVGTRVCRTVQEAREHLGELRAAVAEATGRYGMAPISASTHPFAAWHAQRHTDKERYNTLAQALQGVIRRLLICGMHVHVCVEDEDLRIDLLNQVVYFTPHLLALSCSSPFWEGQDSGLKSYRTPVFRAVPRTGLPEEFTGWSDYQRHVAVLEGAGVIEDATRLWWDVRPSARYPTLELRASDICTSIDDGITIASLYLSLLAMLFRRRVNNQRWRIYSRMLLEENMWRAQRYGVSESLIDFGRGELVGFTQLVDELIELVREDAEELGCLTEVERIRDIARTGTSADRQLHVYNEQLAQGATSEEALRAVVDFLIEETVAGV